MTEYIMGTDGKEGHWLAKELIRCRDCKYYCHEDRECTNQYICAEPDDYCSWAVKDAEAVRCEECKFYSLRKKECALFVLAVGRDEIAHIKDPRGFCAWGERK